MASNHGSDVSDHGQLAYFPFPYTQRLADPIPCDGGLLMVELASTSFSAWADSFSQYIRISEHETLVRLFVSILDRCCEISTDVVLETCVDRIDFWDVHNGKLDMGNVIKSFRLWIPLTQLSAAAFGSVCTAAYPDFAQVEEPVNVKRRRITTTNHLKTKSDLKKSLRLYFEGKLKISELVFDEDEHDNTSHILKVLSAKEYFTQAHNIQKYQYQRLDMTQSALDNYVYQSETGHTYFRPDPKIRDAYLTRLIKTGHNGFFQTGQDLFKYLMPNYIPPKSLVYDKLRRIMDACGSYYDPMVIEKMPIEQIIDLGQERKDDSFKSFHDPIQYSPLEASEMLLERNRAQSSMLDRLLCSVYPISSRLKVTYGERISGSKHLGQDELTRVYRSIVNEIATLLTSTVEGVPDVYFYMNQESIQTWNLIRSDKPKNVEIALSKRMITKRRREESYYTGFGHKWLSITVGCRDCLLLMDKQTSLFQILYARHFAVTANRTGVSGFFIVAGPPDTGKSCGCENWMACVAKALQVQSDGSSAKSYTVATSGRDLRCSYEDEFKDLTADGTDGQSSADMKAKQTLFSNGIISYERLIRNPVTNQFEAHKTTKAERKMTVTCTNALRQVPAAIQSRACCIPLTRTFKKKDGGGKQTLSATTLIATKDHARTNIKKNAFIRQMQFLSSLQGRFWQLEAFGVIGNPETTLYGLFQVMLEKNHGSDIMPPRRVIDIKQTAEALMVFDAVRLWYLAGIGEQHAFDVAVEAMFYRARCVVRMEHITAAFCLLNQNTSLDVHIREVEVALKNMLKIEDGTLHNLHLVSCYF